MCILSKCCELIIMLSVFSAATHWCMCRSVNSQTHLPVFTTKAGMCYQCAPNTLAKR